MHFSRNQVGCAKKNMKIDIPKRTLNFLSSETCSNLKNDNNLINRNLKHKNNQESVSNNEYLWKLQVTINVSRAKEKISKSQYSAKCWIKLTPHRKLYLESQILCTDGFNTISIKQIWKAANNSNFLTATLTSLCSFLVLMLHGNYLLRLNFPGLGSIKMIGLT